MRFKPEEHNLKVKTGESEDMTSKNNVMHSEIPTYTVEERRQHLILKLSNFRTYGDAEIKIPLNSVTLINGPSGVGKTTILEAFIFIMYNGVTSPEKFETKKCLGWLFIGDLVIYRQKDPLLLKVWRSSISPGSPAQKAQEYTNDEAQALINSIYGSQDTFFGCSYLRQKEFSVFLTGSDSDKLELMKTIAMKGSELDEIKNPIKQKVSQLKESCTASRAQFEMALRNIQIFDSKNPNLVQYQVPESSEEVMKKVRELRGKMDTLDEQYMTVVQQEAGVKLLRQQLDMLTAKKSGLEQQAARTDIGRVKTRMAEIDLKLREFSGVSFDASKLAKAQLFKIWTQEIEKLESRIKELEKEYELNVANARRILTEFPAYVSQGLDFKVVDPDRASFQSAVQVFIEKWRAKFESVKSATQDVNLLLSQVAVKSLQEAKTSLASVEQEVIKAKEKEASVRTDLEKKRQANKMKCPGCTAVLVVGEDGKHLEKCQDAPQGIGAMLGTVEPAKTPVIMVTHDDLAAAASNSAALTSKKDRLMAIISAVEEKLKFDLGNVSSDAAITALPVFSKNQELKLALDSLRESLQQKHSQKPEEITEKIADSQEKTSLEFERTNLVKATEGYEQLLRAIEQEGSNHAQFAQMLTDSVQSTGPTSVDIRKQKGEIQAQVDQLMHLSSATELVAQRSILEKTMYEKRRDAEILEKKYLAGVRLMDRTVEAERVSLETALADINSYLGEILKRLFTTIPISVSISTTKELKSKKNAVSQRFDVKVFYNNTEYKSAKQLSGGEKDRLSLAITLAMSQKFGGSILFLDETLSSLDAELKSEAVSLLKELSTNRTVVCISHEETEGLYNHVIHIKANN